MKKRQQRHMAIAVAILVAVGAIFLLMRGGTQQVADEPVEWARVANLERIEIVPPAHTEAPELIVLEKRDRQWRLQRPVEAKMDWSVAERFEARFGRRLVAEELHQVSDRLESYGLSDDQGVLVRLFAAGEERPAREFIIGSETEIVRTGARRTFIKEPGDDRVYRLRADVGELVRLPVRDLRERRIASLDDGKIDGVRIKHDDGHQVEIEEVDGRWTMADGPAARRGVDEQRALRLVTSLASLSAVDFPDESVEELGLDEPTTVVEISSQGRTSTLDIRRIDKGDRPRYVMRRSGDEVVYEIDRRVGEVLTARLSDMRSRSLIPVGSWGITEIRLPGDLRTHLRREDRDSDWEMLAPEGWKPNPRKVQRLAEFVAGLRVHKWVDAREKTDVLPDGSIPTVSTVTIGVEGQETILYLAGEVEDRPGARYAFYSESEDAFILSRDVVERLMAGPQAVGQRK